MRRSTQTPSEITNKLLRKLGLEIDKPDRRGAVQRLRREGGRGEQIWIYTIDLNYSPVHARLLEAAKRKLSEVGSHDFHHSNSPNKEIMTTAPEPPKKGDCVNWRGQRWRVRRVEGAIVVAVHVEDWAEVETSIPIAEVEAPEVAA